MRTKSVPFRIKAAGEHEGTEDGVVEAIVATYDLDSTGDKIVPGAFEKTLEEWAESGDPIPFIWNHQWGDPDAHIGVIEEAKETSEGLWIKARIDLDEPFAAKVYRLLKGRRVKQFSFGYEILEGSFVDGKNEDGSPAGWYELRGLRLFEAGPTLVGANQATRLESVKHSPGGVSEERAREIAAAVVAEVLAAKNSPDTNPEPEPESTSASEPVPVPATEPEPESEPESEPVAGPEPAPATEPAWSDTHLLMTEISDQLRAITEQLAPQTPATEPTATPGPDKDAPVKPSDTAADIRLRAALAGLNADLAELTN